MSIYSVRNIDERVVVKSGCMPVEADTEASAWKRAFEWICQHSRAADLDDMIIEMSSVCEGDHEEDAAEDESPSS